MRKNPLADLVIRTAVVQRPGLGYIYAADLKREAQGDPHAITFIWEDGVFDRGECNYDASSICVVQKPELALVDIAEAGYYSANAKSGMHSGDIIENSQPPSKEDRIRGFRQVSAIAGKAYAAGLKGMVYRLDSVNLWTRIDDGLPTKFHAETVDGFEDTDLYAVGEKGQCWRYDGKKWTKIELPTNTNLNAVKCAGDGTVYIAGNKGVLLRGKRNKWEVIDHDVTDDIWDLEWFDKNLYVSTMNSVYSLTKDGLESMDFGDDRPETCNSLSAAKGVMWSTGAHDIVSFDGKAWTRVV